MHQLTQQLKSGQMEIVEVPVPQLQAGQVLVRNYYSVISAGTEGKTVSDARKGYIAKARSRQKEVKQVIDLVKTQGIKAAYDIVMNKLEALSPLGYSCAGEVIAIAPDVREYRVGDRIACGGSSAVHADIVAVPQNLCAKVDPSVDLKEAAFTTIASIALQGIRQADLQLGSHCTVIGLGLIGLITMKLLQASGVRPFGIDVNSEAVRRAKENFDLMAAERNTPGISEQVLSTTNGHGSDAVIITATTSSTDPVNFAGELCRQKGRVIVVGAVPTGFDRKNYYRKELDLRMSCSYGPGRYDPVYEEKGNDYPVGYVRWTEQRNMQTIVQLLANQKISFADLISHVFPLENATEAYELIVTKKEPHLGIVLEYDQTKTLEKKIVLTEEHHNPSEVNAGILGAGSFAQNVLLPVLKEKINLAALATLTGNSALYTGRKYKFGYISTDPEQLISDPKINTLFIVTRHNMHASQVISGLKAGKHIFVEKPLALNPTQLEEIQLTYQELSGAKPILLTGFNRRFSPSVSKIRTQINPEIPSAIHIRVNAGNLPPSHWVHDHEIGGGRITGEVCHFIDLAIYLAGSRVHQVSANAMDDSAKKEDTLSISLKFENGSIAVINYFSNGNKQLNKEFVEVFNGETVLQIHDFKTTELFSTSGRHKIKLNKQDKGHQQEIIAFTTAIKEGKGSPIPFDELIHSMKVTFLVQDAIHENRVITL